MLICAEMFCFSLWHRRVFSYRDWTGSEGEGGSLRQALPTLHRIKHAMNPMDVLIGQGEFVHGAAGVSRRLIG